MSSKSDKKLEVVLILKEVLAIAIDKIDQDEECLEHALDIVKMSLEVYEQIGEDGQ